MLDIASPGLKVKVTPGWRIWTRSRIGEPVDSMNFGLHMTSFEVLANTAREHKQSSSAIQFKIRYHVLFLLWKWENIEEMNGTRARFVCLCAYSNWLVSALRCGVINLRYPCL
jgi:hypothetical protein